MNFLILVMTIFIVSGCAAKKLAIKNADSFISYQITKTVPLTSNQKKDLDKDIDQLLNNSKTEAKELLPHVDNIDLQNFEKVEKDYQLFEGHYKKLAKDFIVLLAHHLADLNDKQQKELFRNLKEENEKIRKEDNKDRLEQINERIAVFIGKLSAEQEKIIKDYSEYFKSRVSERLKRREELHGTFKSIFQENPLAADKQAHFVEAFMKYQTNSLAASKNLEILKKFVPTVSSEQVKHFKQKASEISDLMKYYISTSY